MTELIDGAIVVELSTSWIELPAPGPDAASALAELVAGLEIPAEEARDRLARSLASVLAITAELAPGERRSHALILAPTTGRVDAILSMRVVMVVPEAYDNYLAAARALEGRDDVELLNHVVEEVALPLGRAILTRDFIQPVSDGGVPAPATERGFLAVFVDGHDFAAEFTVLTQNLALFDDLGSYLMALASGENPPLIQDGMTV